MGETSPWVWGELAADPRDWVLASSDPAAHWALLTGVLDRTAADPAVERAHAAVLTHPDTADLLARLAPWDSGRAVSGHDHPHYAPNLLTLLADRGLRADDDPRIDAVLTQMLEHQQPDGHLPAYAPPRAGEAPVWGALLCDHHAVVDVLLRYGRGHDPRVAVALATMVADLRQTPQGPAWPCVPHPVTGFRGPGRKADMCPQVTLEALRAMSRLAPDARPTWLLDVARTSLGCWRERAHTKPYMFGHGRHFKTGKWPLTWYSAHSMLDSLGRYPALWRGPDARPHDRQALAELVACLVAYTLGPAGRVVPRSVYRGFEGHSFGQKVEPSAFATALVLTVLHRLEDLATDAAHVDLATLESSSGGTGTPLPPATPRA